MDPKAPMDSHGLQPVLHYQSKSRIEDKVREEVGKTALAPEAGTWERGGRTSLKAVPLPRPRSCWTVVKTTSVCLTYSWKYMGEWDCHMTERRGHSVWPSEVCKHLWAWVCLQGVFISLALDKLNAVLSMQHLALCLPELGPSQQGQSCCVIPMSHCSGLWIHSSMSLPCVPLQGEETCVPG